MLTLEPTADLKAWWPRVRERLLAQRIEGGQRRDDAMAQVGGLLGDVFVDGQLAAPHRIWRVVPSDHDQQSGWVWLRHAGGEAVATLVAVDPGGVDHGELVDLVVSRLRGDGATSLRTSRWAGDAATAAFTVDRAVDVAGVRMVLDLAHDQQPAPEQRPSSVVLLVPMTRQQFDAYRARGVQHYADELVKAGVVTDPAAAVAASTQQHEALLPDGRETEGHWLWSAVVDEVDVGILWLTLNGVGRPADQAFIYDIEVLPDHRRRGHGEAILHAAADAARDRGAAVLALHVFGTNDGARRLYERQGFVTTEEMITIAL
ncbi:GNAT family N-acetyltransferase [Microlunatus sp. Y2014]|uniref:GNAT family N-acetyltransferase n=1 Tax=Microlunatus sp. Y2014 TaxID=3418488 RepID=UPI003DA761D0